MLMSKSVFSRVGDFPLSGDFALSLDGEICHCCQCGHWWNNCCTLRSACRSANILHGSLNTPPRVDADDFNEEVLDIVLSPFDRFRELRVAQKLAESHSNGFLTQARREFDGAGVFRALRFVAAGVYGGAT